MVSTLSPGSQGGHLSDREGWPGAPCVGCRFRACLNFLTIPYSLGRIVGYPETERARQVRLLEDRHFSRLPVIRPNGERPPD